MNTYTQWLNIDFDPFAPNVASRDFYSSAHRQKILDQIVEFSLYSNAMIAVTGPLGAGKTTLATHFCDRFAEEAVCVKVAATLFMNQTQFLEILQDGLDLKPANSEDSNSTIEQICRYAADLDLEARSLILIIDDAHELSAEVLQLLAQLLEGCVDSSIHALLFGENQLDSLLQSTLTAAAQERLAILPLDGFASDETHEYIRFKLATARFTKELPIDGGIIGAIHNSSEGMPGAINALVVDALNSAAPASESEERETMAPALEDDSVEQDAEHDAIEALVDYDLGEEGDPEQFDEFEAIEALEGFDLDDEAEPEKIIEFEAVEALEGDELEEEGEGDPEQAWIASIQPRYWAAAATLAVLLSATLLFWESEPRETESIPITVSVTPNSVQAIEADLVAAAPVQTTADDVVAVEVDESLASGAEDLDDLDLTAIVSAEEVAAEEVTAEEIVAEEMVAEELEAEELVVAVDELRGSGVEDSDASISPAIEAVKEVVATETVAAVNNDAQIAASPEVAEQLIELAVVEASPFVEQLLQASPRNYAVQLIASHSEANISEFLAQLDGEHPAGYFETRYQDKPWFVVVLAPFDDREQATRAIASLPEKLRSNEPWARSVAGIQTDIRELLDSKLVSGK